MMMRTLHAPLTVALCLALAAGCASAPAPVGSTASTAPAASRPPPTDARAAFATDPSREIPDAFDETADAKADVDAALARAAERGTKVLLVMGGNWCPDSRSLAWRLAQPELASLVGDDYELVYVDVGFMNRNIDIAQRFGLSGIEGTPTVLVLAADGTLLNADSTSAWRTARSSSVADVSEYFSRWAGH